MKRGEKLDKEYADTKPKPLEGKNISFSQWKRRGGGSSGSGSKFSL